MLPIYFMYLTTVMRHRCFGGDRRRSGRADPATNQRVRGFHLWEAEKEVAFRWDSKKIKFVGRRRDRVTLKIKEIAVWSSGISLPWAGLCHLLYLSSFLLRLPRPSAHTSHFLLNSFPMHWPGIFAFYHSKVHTM